MPETLTVAVAQCPADLEPPEERLDWLAGLLASHEDAMLDLIVLPELFQCGYNIGDFSSKHAEPPDGPFATSIAELAKRYRTAILYGFAEQQTEGLYNSAQCIGQNGQIIGRHRKLLLPPGFEQDNFVIGRECKLFRLGAFTLAILVCYDVEFPENMRHVAVAGADLVVVPTALANEWSVVSECVIPTRAFENGVFVCYSNYCGQENGLTYYGGSCIIAPDGSTLARNKNSAGLSIAHLDRSSVKAAQARMPYHADHVKLPWVRNIR
ncbi:MAG: carbon-nitrogen hydrolase family protein [Roseibium sp.]|uniref:carbon-nitrogen hydrolase family protein n=1 Tax=Roseibium sp. TaxID=1936156 RepID=UPI002619F108|nr:carbon-nitrogen hydrolase family protein [Roseibium sp.]MCV0429891.1 carbon-nitrogen hydrolase family protein [Roseibium sp.]